MTTNHIRAIMSDFLAVNDALMAKNPNALPGRVMYDLVSAFDAANGGEFRHVCNFNGASQTAALDLYQNLKAHSRTDEFYGFLDSYLDDAGVKGELKYKPGQP